MLSAQVRNAHVILKDLGHDISLGHCYELLSRLQDYPSHNHNKEKTCLKFEKELGTTYKEKPMVWIEGVLNRIRISLNGDNQPLSRRSLHELEDFFIKYAEEKAKEENPDELESIDFNSRTNYFEEKLEDIKDMIKDDNDENKHIIATIVNPEPECIINEIDNTYRIDPLATPSPTKDELNKINKVMMEATGMRFSDDMEFEGVPDKDAYEKISNKYKEKLEAIANGTLEFPISEEVYTYVYGSTLDYLFIELKNWNMKKTYIV